MIAMLLFGGIASGLSFVDPEASFGQIMDIGSVYLPGRTLAWALISAGHIIFALHFVLMLLRIGQPGEGARRSGWRSPIEGITLGVLDLWPRVGLPSRHHFRQYIRPRGLKREARPD